MGGQPIWSNKKNEYMSKKSEKLRVKKLSTGIKTSSSQPTVSVSTYTVVDEMAQAFLPMVTVLDFTPTQPNPPVLTQAFTNTANTPSSNTSIHTCDYCASIFTSTANTPSSDTSIHTCGYYARCYSNTAKSPLIQRTNHKEGALHKNAITRSAAPVIDPMHCHALPVDGDG
jgi:hypothetical protein